LRYWLCPLSQAPIHRNGSLSLYLLIGNGRKEIKDSASLKWTIFETFLAGGTPHQTLFTQLPRRGVLGRSDAASWIAPVLCGMHPPLA
jgi:hypothetical protein